MYEVQYCKRINALRKQNIFYDKGNNKILYDYQECEDTYTQHDREKFKIIIMLI